MGTALGLGGTAWNDPVHRLPGDRRVQVVFVVVVQDGHAVSLGGRRDQQVGQCRAPVRALPCELGLHPQRSSPHVVRHGQ